MATVLRGVASAAAPLKGLRSLAGFAQLKSINTSVNDKHVNGLNPLLVPSLRNELASNNSFTSLKFLPTSITNFNEPLYRTSLPIMDMPRLPISTILPKITNLPVLDVPGVFRNDMDCPADSDKGEMHAARLIVIRRRKMRIHKLKKLRKRMKFKWAKRDKNRKIKKEKAFEALLLSKLKAAEQWSPEQYVTEKLNQLNEVILPKYWKGVRVPEFLVRQYMGLDPRIEYKQFKTFDKKRSKT